MDYIKKPKPIKAIKYTGKGNFEHVGLPEWIWEAFEDKTLTATNGDDPLILKTVEGTLVVSPGDFICRAESGQIFPYTDDLFKRTYQPASESVKEDWIDVKDRLPEESGHMLVYTDKMMRGSMWYSRQYGWHTLKEQASVTHWMPLPQPPKI